MGLYLNCSRPINDFTTASWKYSRIRPSKGFNYRMSIKKCYFFLGSLPQGGGGVLLPSHSSERLIDNPQMGSQQTLLGAGQLQQQQQQQQQQPGTNDFVYYSEMLPPELARQLMLGEWLYLCSIRFAKKICRLSQPISVDIFLKLLYTYSMSHFAVSFFVRLARPLITSPVFVCVPTLL